MSLWELDESGQPLFKKMLQLFLEPINDARERRIKDLMQRFRNQQDVQKFLNNPRCLLVMILKAIQEEKSKKHLLELDFGEFDIIEFLIDKAFSCENSEFNAIFTLIETILSQCHTLRYRTPEDN